MRSFRSAGLLAGLLLLAASSATLLAQDSTGMKAGATTDGKMDHGMMMKDDGLAPHAMFSGANKHTVSGGYHVVIEGDKRSLVLDSDFALDGAPDPYIVLSADDMGSSKGTLNLGRLRQQKGSSHAAHRRDRDGRCAHHGAGGLDHGSAPGDRAGAPDDVREGREGGKQCRPAASCEPPPLPPSRPPAPSRPSPTSAETPLPA